MNKKAQIFTLDVIIALIIVIFSLGIIMQLIEFTTYSNIEKENYEILKKIGRTAANLLVSNPNILISVTDKGNEIFKPNNWLDSKKSIKKEDLGVPKDYNVCIMREVLGTEMVAAGEQIGIAEDVKNCADIKNELENVKNIYSEKRAVLIGSDIEKNRYYNCINGIDKRCKGSVNIIIKVWR